MILKQINTTVTILQSTALITHWYNSLLTEFLTQPFLQCESTFFLILLSPDGRCGVFINFEIVNTVQFSNDAILISYINILCVLQGFYCNYFMYYVSFEFFKMKLAATPWRWWYSSKTWGINTITIYVILPCTLLVNKDTVQCSC